MLLNLLNWVFILVVAGAVLVIALSNNCAHFHPMPTPQQLDDVDVNAVFNLVYELNIYTNIVIAIPGLMLLFSGFVVEGTIILLTALFSTMWHVTGEHVWSTLDWIFAALTGLITVMLLLRIAQVRGWPEFVAFWIVLPLMALIAWSGFDQSGSSTNYFRGRVSHALWHVLNGATLIILVVELLRAVPAVPSHRLRHAALNKDVRMWERWRGSRSVSLVFDLFKDLAAPRTHKKDGPPDTASGGDLGRESP